MRWVTLGGWRRLAARLFACMLLLGIGSSPASAQAQHERPPTDRGPHRPHPEALEAIDRVKSPFCPGFMLEVCPSPDAAALRDTLDAMARRGISSDSLVGWTLVRYGDTLRALPKASGRSLIAWLVPPLAVVLGVAAVVLVLSKLRSPREEPLGEDVSDEERERLANALRELEAGEETFY